MRKECLSADSGNDFSSSTSATSVTVKDGMLLRRPQTAMLQIQQTDSVKMARPKTPMTLAAIVECERVRQLDGEPTVQNRLTSRLPIKKVTTTRSAHSDGIQAGQVAQSLIQVAPGYFLTRSKQKLRVTLKDELFIPSHAEKKPQSSQPDPEIQQLLEDLKQEVADLSLFLEEERLSHNRTRKQAAELLKDKTDELKKTHDEALRQQKEWQAEDMARVLESHRREVENTKAQTDSTIARLHSEVDFLQSAFNTFKTQANIEYQNSLHEHDAELEEKHMQHLHAVTSELRTKLANEKNTEKAKLEKEHFKEMARLQKEHKREIEALNRKYSSHADDLETLQHTQVELQEEKQKLSDLQSNYNGVCQELAALKHAFSDTKARLQDYERNFELKIQQVDEKYQERMDNLMKTNTELRRMYLKKCDELFKVAAEAETTNVKRVTTAKDVMKLYGLRRSQSQPDMRHLRRSAPASNLFSRLHFHDLGADLWLWLDANDIMARAPRFLAPATLAYYRRLKSLVYRKRLPKKAALFPPLPTCHRLRCLRCYMYNQRKRHKSTVAD